MWNQELGLWNVECRSGRLSVAALLIALASGGGLQAQAAPSTLTVTSTAFKNGDAIPIDYTADGRNISPPLRWAGAPNTTREFALILDDPDATTPLPFVHWVIYKIPANVTGLPEALPMGGAVKAPGIEMAIQGATGFAMYARGGGPPPQPGYRGPAPPPGKPHHYTFHLFALNAPLDAKDGMTRDDLLKAMDGKIVAQGELVGVYERKARQ
jgi:Raf kinase inhibitor-like YbhB/YbcL family protein